jgi:hypothetical protein
VFQQYTSIDLTHYQSYDKALDVYYLCLAYLSTMRNWLHGEAFAIARFLFYYRLVGVNLFEVVFPNNRALLLIFANTFEYFFIFFQAVQTRRDTRLLSARFWLRAAAFIWVFIKLPQEYWIHVAQLDVTDTVAAYPAASAVVALVGAVVVVVLVTWLRRRMPPPDHRLTLKAPPLPSDLARGEVRRARRVARGGVFDRALLEKVVLLSLVTTIFAQILPSVDATATQVAVAVSVVVVLNSAVGLVAARAGHGFDSALGSFGALAVVNAGLVVVARLLRPDRPALDTGDTLFFILLVTLIVSLYERYEPVHEVHEASWRARGQGS